MQLRAPRSLWAKGATMLMAATTIAGLSMGSAFAQGPQNNAVSGIGVSATIGNGSSDSPTSGTPTIECSWILTDDNPMGGAETQQYSFAEGQDLGPTNTSLSYVNYTQPAESPGAPSSGSPNAASFAGSPNSATSFVYGDDDNPSAYLTTPNCSSTNTSGSQPSQMSGSQTAPVSTGIQVLPNSFDNPAPRRLVVWAAVDNATAVNFNVFYPNGAEDTDLGGVQIGGSPQACSSYSTSGSLLNTMFNWAGPSHSNQVSAYAITNTPGTGIVDLCNDNEKSLWYQTFLVSKDDPNGTYTVEVQAINSAGTTESWISFYVIPFFDLAVDFSSVSIQCSQTTPIVCFASGDTSFQPPNSAFPTVTNGGNEGMQVGVNFSPLKYTPPVGSPYYISSFDANLGYNASDVLSADLPATAGTTLWISNNGSSPATGPQLVCPNDTPELDLSAEPTTADPPGTYTGTLTVMGKADVVTGSGSGGCVTDNGAPYILTSGKYKSLTDLDPNPIVRS
jgi:hypothetical protein